MRQKADAIAAIALRRVKQNGEKWKLEFQRSRGNFLNRSRDQFEVISEKLITARDRNAVLSHGMEAKAGFKSRACLTHLVRRPPGCPECLVFGRIWWCFDLYEKLLTTPTYVASRALAINSLSWVIRVQRNPTGLATAGSRTIEASFSIA